jgi:Mg-chelatase subunit ChlD
MPKPQLVRGPGALVRRASAITLIAGVSLIGALTAAAVDSFDPAVVTLTLQAGESRDVEKTLHLDALPGAADIIIAIDTTGSMGGAIAQAKAQATQLCSDVQTAIPGARFAVFDFRDVPDRPLTQGVLILTPVFTSSCLAVQTAVNTMAAGGGGDTPEAYNWVFNKAYSDATLDASRGANAVQFLVVLGDAPPHNSPAPSVAPACGNTPPADVGITSTSEIAGLNANDITLLMINYGPMLSCYSQLAGATGGTAVNSGGNLSPTIISQIQTAASQINSVNLVVSAGCPIGISFNPTPPYGPFTAPVDINFTETITAPTTVGTYACTVTANVDGTDRAVQTINVTVVAGAPATLVLMPPSETNTVGDPHTVTATVRDAFGNPTPGIVVRFTVLGATATFATPASGSDTTDAAGQATFTFTAALPGGNGIHAFADTNNDGDEDPGEPFGDATKTWILPVGTALCEIKITGGGRITAVNGDKATFGGNARSDADGNASGNEEYQDHGPAQAMTVKSIDILAITCTTDFKTANIYGTATIDGSGTFAFRIRATDNLEPGTGSDVYGIILSTGYNSGDKVLEGGNIQIHKLP